MKNQITPGEVLIAIRAGHQRFKAIRDHLDVNPDLLRHMLRMLSRQKKIISSSNRVWFVY